MYWLRRSSAASAVAAIALAGCYDLDKLRMVDGAMADGAKDCGGAILCDDFEAAVLDAAIWTANTANGAITIDDAQPHSGSRSLHVHMDRRPADTLGRATIETTKPFPLASLHARAYLRAHSANGDFTILSVVHGASEFHDGVSVWRDDGTAQISVNEFDSNTGGHNKPGFATSPVDMWHCLEWEVTNLDGASGSVGIVHVWVDGVMSVEDLAAPTARSPAFDLFLLGTRTLANYGDDAFDFWIDDVAVGRTRIGCVL